MHRVRFVLSLLAGCALATSLALADRSESLGDPVGLVLVPGTGYAAAGTGLSTGQPAGISLSIPPGARVVQAILYWEGNSVTTLDVPATGTTAMGSVPVRDRSGGGSSGFAFLALLGMVAGIRRMSGRQEI